MKYYVFSNKQEQKYDIEAISKKCLSWFRKKCLANKRSYTMKQYMLHMAASEIVVDSDDILKLKYSPSMEARNRCNIKIIYDSCAHYASFMTSSHGITDCLHKSDNFVYLGDDHLVVYDKILTVRSTDENSSDKIFALFTVYPNSIFYEMLIDPHIVFGDAENSSISSRKFTEHEISKLLRNNTETIMIDVLTGDMYNPKLTLPGDTTLNSDSLSYYTKEHTLKTSCNLFGEFQATKGSKYDIPVISTNDSISTYLYSLTQDSYLCNKICNSNEKESNSIFADITTTMPKNDKFHLGNKEYQRFFSIAELVCKENDLNGFRELIDQSLDNVADRAGLPTGWFSCYNNQDVENIHKEILMSRSVNSPVLNMFRIFNFIEDIDTNGKVETYYSKVENDVYVIDLSKVVTFVSDINEDEGFNPYNANGIHLLAYNWRLISSGLFKIIGDRNKTLDYFMDGCHEKN